jgi:hypothetical protein
MNHLNIRNAVTCPLLRLMFVARILNLCVMLAMSATIHADETKPNIVIIFTDDKC